MHADEYERHRFCVEFLTPLSPKSILDVGGTHLLNRFFPDVTILSLNIDNSGDIQYDGGDFPFVSNSFDMVVTLDTLEHVQLENRRHFINECLRIAKKGVVIAAPYGSTAHQQAEVHLCKFMDDAGRPNRWLKEHIQQGLPAPNEVREYELLFTDRDFATTVYFAGDYDWQCQNLKLATRLSKSGFPDRLANLVSFVLGLRIWHPPRFSIYPTPVTNRFYILGAKNGHV
jgi:hypothetical protein